MTGVGLLAALAVEGTMVAIDKPDTRSWTFLPARVLIARLRLPAGEHSIDIQIDGLPEASRTVPLDLSPGGFAVIPLAQLR